jgi:hypothetical protein
MFPNWTQKASVSNIRPNGPYSSMDEVTTEPHSTSTIASKELHVVSFHYTEDNRHWSLLGDIFTGTSTLKSTNLAAKCITVKQNKE